MQRFFDLPMRAGLILLAVGMVSCAQTPEAVPEVPRHPPAPAAPEVFGFQKWVAADTDPDTVVIGVHGFSGASVDYRNLGEYLLEHQPRTAVYAYEVRGQGQDPDPARRGDIDDPRWWAVDLLTFTRKVRDRHPRARIIWFGESMGALIISHTFAEEMAAAARPPCDALCLASPVVAIDDELPAWKRRVVRTIARLVPTARIRLDALAAGQDVQMTGDSTYAEQAHTNPWHVESHTLRLLVTLGDLIESMSAYARFFDVPTLVLHGGKDFFTEPDEVRRFAGKIPKSTPSRRQFYPHGHHLLMYDSVKKKVIPDIADWIDSLRQ